MIHRNLATLVTSSIYTTNNIFYLLLVLILVSLLSPKALAQFTPCSLVPTSVSDDASNKVSLEHHILIPSPTVEQVNVNWLSWTEDNKVPILTGSLILPGNLAQIILTGYYLGVDGWTSFVFNDQANCGNKPPLAQDDYYQLAESTGMTVSAIASGEDVTVNNPPGPTLRLPPEPSGIAPALNLTEVTDFLASTAFLYSGEHLIQTGVAPGTIEAERVVVIRGTVLDRDNIALSGVTISVKDHREFGQTLSRKNGAFDIAVNGGGLLTLHYQKDGYLPVQRQVKTPRRDYAYSDDVVMIPLDLIVTTVDLSSDQPMQVAQGSVQTDADGSRQATVFFPQGTTATMTMPDGAVNSLTKLNVRATEYTVGDNGPQSMPGKLPVASGYTYAVELSIDEAIAANASMVHFNQPLPFYVDNFLNFPPGEAVPIGWYDTKKTAWIPAPNGRVIKILSITNGLADLDLDGNGSSADNNGLLTLGFTDAERAQLALIYPVGKTLWRSLISHFTPWDCNWPFGPPMDALEPAVADPVIDNENTPDPKDAENCKGCIIEAQSQVLGEEVPIVGTPFKLHYRSDRVAGRNTGMAVTIPLIDDNVSPSLKFIELTINIAGRTIQRVFPAVSNQSTTFTWDGLDSYGRNINYAKAKITLGYVYNAVYYPARQDLEASFASFSDAINGIGLRNNNMVKLEKTWQKELGNWDISTAAIGLGGWSLTPQHAYNKIGQVFHSGDGDKRSNKSISPVVELMAGGKHFNNLSGFDFGSDGNIYIEDGYQFSIIWKITPEGVISHFAGNGTVGFSGDGGPAVEASFSRFLSIAVAPDNSVYIADEGNNCIRKIDPQGNITTIAGTGVFGNNGDGGLAINADIAEPQSIVIGSDSSIYIGGGWYDNPGYIRKIDPSGVISTIAGSGTSGFSGDGGLATQANLFGADDMELDSSGNIFFIDGVNNRIRKVAVDGVITTVAGNGEDHPNDGNYTGLATEAGIGFGLGIDISSNDNIYFAGNNQSIMRINSQGLLYPVRGNGTWWEYDPIWSVIDAPAISTSVNVLGGFALDPDDNLYVAQDDRITRVSSWAGSLNASAEDIFVADATGKEIHKFDVMGRHLATFDTTTKEILYSFTYTDEGYLSTITDIDGDAITIDRNSDGTPVAIVAPDGQRTNLIVDAKGYLSRIINPANEAHQFTYTPDGLMTSYTNPSNNINDYQYDSVGRLIKDTNPAGGGWTLNRTDSINNNQYTVTMSSGEGRARHFSVKRFINGDRLQTKTAPDGNQTVTLFGIDGTESTTTANGTLVHQKSGPDPRFGMLSPVLEELKITMPSGLVNSLTFIRSAELDNEKDLLSHSQLSESMSFNGNIYSRDFNRASLTWRASSPENRQNTAMLNQQGRVIQQSVPGFADIIYDYDDRGRLSAIAAGIGVDARVITFGYGADGFLSTVTDPLGQVETFERDAAGRITGQSLADNRIINYSYDAGGNLVSLTPPGSSSHHFDYTIMDLESIYTPPAAAGIGSVMTRHDYNLDQQLELSTRPDGQTIDRVYNPVTGKQTATIIPRGSYQYDYHVTTGQLTKITAPDGGSLSYAYDGGLLLSNSWLGAVAGEVSQSYNNDFLINERQVNGSHNVAFAYDRDQLLVQAGNLTIDHDSKNGLIIGTSLNTVVTTHNYNMFGELASYGTSAGVNDLYHVDYTRDKLGRIVSEVETVADVITTRQYQYDAAGRLVQLDTNGTITASYSYDSNSNRTHVNGVKLGSYDAQDRLVSYAGFDYSYSANGELLTKTAIGPNQATQYKYDVLGNLIQATLPDNTRIDYIIDGQNRRIGKKINNTLSQGFLYKDQLNPVAELDNNGDVVAIFVYGDKAHVPAYMEKRGITYRIISDHLGSPRLVINSQSGDIVQRLDYDVWGNIILDTNPGFQPFGFAGGLYDQHTKLTRFGARDYDAYVGRWTAKDPIGFSGGINLYSYVANDPVNLIDPTGLYCLSASVINGISGFVSGFVSGLIETKNPWLAVGLGAINGLTGYFSGPQAAGITTGAISGGFASGSVSPKGFVVGGISSTFGSIQSTQLGAWAGGFLGGVFGYNKPRYTDAKSFKGSGFGIGLKGGNAGVGGALSGNATTWILNQANKEFGDCGCGG